MMEQPHALLDKRDTQLLRRFEHRGVVLASARGGDVFGAGAGGAEDVVDEGELFSVVSFPIPRSGLVSSRSERA
jgi:hypothetical protein